MRLGGRGWGMSRAELAAWGLWIVFVVIWQILARWTARATTPSSPGARVGWFLAYFLSFGLLFVRFWRPMLPVLQWPAPLWRDPAAVAWGLVLVEVGFFAFAFWARRHLGLLWSGMLTLREGHKVVDTGPYRFVRHPIYTGFIGAGWMMALIGAEPERLAGAAVLTLTMAIKAKVEERLLRRELGPAGYNAYAARTPMLIPFSPR